jgi:hypothetical protein
MLRGVSIYATLYKIYALCDSCHPIFARMNWKGKYNPKFARMHWKLTRFAIIFGSV